MSTVSRLGVLAARQQVQDYKANDPSMRILSQGPVTDKDFLYHASGKAWLNNKPTAVTDAARAAKAKEVRKAIAAFSKQRNIDPNEALLLAGGSMYFRGIKDDINDIDFTHPGLKDFTKQTVGKYELDGGPGGMPADAYASDKLHGLNVQKPAAILAFYKFLNRPKDQQKIQMLNDLVNSQNKQG